MEAVEELGGFDHGCDVGRTVRLPGRCGWTMFRDGVGKKAISSKGVCWKAICRGREESREKKDDVSVEEQPVTNKKRSSSKYASETQNGSRMRVDLEKKFSSSSIEAKRPAKYRCGSHTV